MSFIQNISYAKMPGFNNINIFKPKIYIVAHYYMETSNKLNIEKTFKMMLGL